MSLFDLVVRRPVAVWMIAIAAAVFGLVSYERLPLDLMPDLSYPTITVRTEVEGYAPEEVESQISRPIEEALATTQGLVELESRSRAGTSDVLLEFTWGSDMDRAAQDIRERLQTTWLPDDADRPLILRYDPSLDPILRISLSTDPDNADVPSGNAALYLLRELAERELKRELEAMDGVAAVRVRGGLEREVLVEAREDWLAARGITIEQLANTLGAENVNVPGGAIRDGDQEYLVRTLNEVRTVDEIGALEVLRSDGVRVPVSHLATVSEAHKDREVVSLLDGREAVELEVFKAADANIVNVAREIKARLGTDAVELPPGMGGPGMDGGEGASGWGMGPPTLQSQLPDGVVMVVLEDQARFIEAAIGNLRSTAILGAFLAVGVLFMFLRDFRATAIIATAIPLSIIVTFAPMYLGGVSLNLMSLGGLALGIGMLVDNAVVVLENIQVKLEEGLARRDAAVEGAKSIAAAVTASTLTTVCVFLPIAFVEGIAGQVFGDLSLAVVFSLLASLVVALLFVPMLAAAELSLPADRGRLAAVSRAARFGSIAQLRDAWRARSGLRRLVWLPWGLLRFATRLVFELASAVVVFPLALFGRMAAGVANVVLPRLARMAMGAADRFNRVYARLAGNYDGVIQRALDRPGRVLGIAALTVAICLPISQGVGQVLIPEVHQGRFTADLALPVGTPLARTIAMAKRVEVEVREHPEIEHVFATIGSENRADSRPDEGEHTARLAIEMTPGGDLARREARLMTAVRDIIRQTAHEDSARGEQRLAVRMGRPELFTFSTPVEVELYSQDLGRLRAASDEAQQILAGVDGLADVRSSLTAGYPEVRLHYDRALLERVGLDTATVARQLKNKVQGEAATTLSRGDGRLDLVVRLDENDRRSLDDLRRINVNPALTPMIPLEAVATLEQAEGPSEIRRVDQRRAAVITANIEGFDLSGRAEAISAALFQDLGPPSGSRGVEWELAGQNQEMERSLSSLQLALGLAIFLVYVIMASTFESVLHPFVILFSVPLALVGVVVVLALTGTPASVVVFIGAIVLAGVVVNNAIVMVDTVNRMRADGRPRRDALAAAAQLRLRPILITTATTVLGLLPLALGVGEGAEVQRPLALTIIAGLTSSTLLTLVVIPVVYRVLTRALERRDAPAPAPSPAPGFGK